jgi:hypothetical protein
MNTLTSNPDRFESTYALLMRSEEKQRSRFETLVYTLLIASAVFAVSQFGRQAVTMPGSIPRVTAAESACSVRCA